MHPALVDSLKINIPLEGTVGGDTIKTTISADSAAIADYFHRIYDPLLSKRDSIVNLLESGNLTLEQEIAALAALNESESDLANSRQAVIVEAYPDTTLVLTLDTNLIINGDTSVIEVNAEVNFVDGKVNLSLYLPPQEINLEVEDTTPDFKVTKTLDWWVYVLIGLVGLIILIRILKK
jgi:hypothetical protein